MWWNLQKCGGQAVLFRALHETDDDKSQCSRGKFFVVALACSFVWYLFPGFLFTSLSSIVLLCLIFPKSVTAQQIGSGMSGLGIGAITFDWSVVASYLQSPLVTPFFSIVNIFVGYVVVLYLIVPVAYWGLNTYNAKTFPLFSEDLFDSSGQTYNISAIVNDHFELDLDMYNKQGRVNMPIFFALSYALNFAGVVATLTHVIMFNGKEILERYRASYEGKLDIHSRLMRKYKDIPAWWFYSMLFVALALSLVLCTAMKDQVQLPWWGLIFAAGIALLFALPISIITATTNQVVQITGGHLLFLSSLQTPGLNVITEYIMGVVYSGRPIANVCFKTYGYISMAQAVSFLSDFKLGHYMKIPPRSMFMVQLVGTLIAGTIKMSTAWYLLTNIDNICHPDKLPSNSPWTRRSDHIFFDASVIWGLVGPLRMFGPQGNYGALNWWFLGGAVGPVVVWILHKSFPKQERIKLINLPMKYPK